MKGREAVVTFVNGVSTRVSAVNIISIAVDFPDGKRCLADDNDQRRPVPAQFLST